MWFAFLTGNKNCFEDIRQNFSEHIKIKDGKYYIVYSEFKSLKTHIEVFKCAEKKLNTLLGILKLFGINCNVKVTNVIREDETGIKHTSTDLRTTVNIRNRDKKSSKELLNKWSECSQANEDVALVFRYYNAISDENICYNLYNIYEIIKNDLKNESDLLDILKVSKNKRRKLTQTLNNLCGEKSRHPPDIDRQRQHMSLDEAKSIIITGLKNWLKIKT